jgi:hypothetical protein
MNRPRQFRRTATPHSQQARDESALHFQSPPRRCKSEGKPRIQHDITSKAGAMVQRSKFIPVPIYWGHNICVPVPLRVQAANPGRRDRLDTLVFVALCAAVGATCLASAKAASLVRPLRASARPTATRTRAMARHRRHKSERPRCGAELMSPGGKRAVACGGARRRGDGRCRRHGTNIDCSPRCLRKDKSQSCAQRGKC